MHRDSISTTTSSALSLPDFRQGEQGLRDDRTKGRDDFVMEGNHGSVLVTCATSFLEGPKRIITGGAMVVFSMIIYVPFLFAVLFQSCVQKKPVDTNNWQVELQRGSWLFGFFLFLFMIIYPIVFLYGIVPHASDSVTKETIAAVFLVIFFAVILSVDLATVYYVELREDLAFLRTLRFEKALNFKMQLIANYATIILEFLQLSSTAFIDKEHGIRSGSSVSPIFSLSILSLDQESFFLGSFYSAVGIIILYSLLIGIFISWGLSVDHFLGTILFDIMAGMLYIMISSRLLSGLDCQSENGELVLESYGKMKCWENEHKTIVVTLFMCITFYASTAIFVSCYRGDTRKDGIRTLPKFLAIERTLKGVYACITTFYSTYSLVSGVTALITTGLLIRLTHRMRPCNLKVSNHIRIYTLTASFACAVVHLLLITVEMATKEKLDSVRSGLWYTLVAFWVVLFVYAAYRIRTHKRSFLDGQPRYQTKTGSREYDNPTQASDGITQAGVP